MFAVVVGVPRLTCRKLPHSGEELGETTVTEGETNDDIRSIDTTSTSVVE